MRLTIPAPTATAAIRVATAPSRAAIAASTPPRCARSRTGTAAATLSLVFPLTGKGLSAYVAKRCFHGIGRCSATRLGVPVTTVIAAPLA